MTEKGIMRHMKITWIKRGDKTFSKEKKNADLLEPDV